MLASLGANQEQIGNIDAGDQHHEADGAHDSPKNTADVADDFLLKRGKVGVILHVHVPVWVGSGAVGE